MTASPKAAAKRADLSIKAARQLRLAAKALRELSRAAVECNDDPRAGQPNDNRLMLASECEELGCHFESVYGPR